MKTIEFIKDRNSLVLLYSPEAFYNGIIEKYRKEGEITIKRCFTVTAIDEYSLEDDDWYNTEETIAFKIGKLIGDYYKLDKKILGTTHDFYFHKDTKFNSKLFIAERNITILNKIDSLIQSDLYIGGSNEVAISKDVYDELIGKFPTTHELALYSHKRIAQVLRNYFDGFGEITDKYEKYLNKRINVVVDSTFYSENKLKLSILKAVHEKMIAMIKEEEGFSEKQWQEIVKDALLLIYPKYILAERELIVGTDGHHKKKPDFLLIDASGFVDVLEIKKPNDQRLITKTTYRNNYVADRDLAGAIVQIEKYVQCLNRSGKSGEEKLQSILNHKIPKDLSLKVVNPQGMLLMGRSEGLNAEQLYDLELVKRQHKNIVDILTYDDLIYRLNNMITQLEIES